MPSLPLYAPIQSRDGTLTKGAFLKNAFVEKVGEAIDTFRRPGLTQYSTFGSAAVGRGMVSMKDYNDEEHLYSAFGGSVYSDGVLRTAGSWAQIAVPKITSGTQFIVHPTLVNYRGYLFAFGPGNVDEQQPGSCTRFMSAYSTDSGATWINLVNVADGAAGYPRGTVSYHVAVFGGKIWLISHQTSTYAHVWTTENGVTFTQVSAAHGMTGTVERLVAHSDSKLKAFTINGTTNRVYESAAGTSWAQLTAAPAYNVSGAGRDQFGAVSYGGNLYVLGGSESTLANSRRVYRSTDHGTTWAQLGSEVLTSIVTSNVNCCFAFMGGPVAWLVVQDLNGGANVTYYSTDFQAWTLFKTEATEIFMNNNVSNLTDSVRLAGDYFVAAVRKVTTNPNIARLSASISGSSLVSVASITGKFLDFTQNSARDKVMFKSDTAAYQIDVEYGVLSSVSDADYPATTTRGLVYLNGTYYVMDPDGTIWGSADDDPTSWSALNFISAEFESDGGVCLTKYGFYVVAFGQFTTEMFYDAGNATGSPLSPVQNGVLSAGCADGDTVSLVNDTIIFVARNKSDGQAVSGDVFIAQLEGASYKRISSPDIDRVLAADDFADAESVTFAVGGHSYYCLNLGTSALSLVYDLSQQTWTVWNRRRTSFTQTMSNVVTTNGTATATITYSGSDGDVGVITAGTATHTSLNGTYNMIVPASGTLCWALSGTSYAGTATATLTGTGWTATDFGIVAACVYQGSLLGQDATNGKLYTISQSAYQDDSVYMDWQARLQKLDMDNNKMKYAALADFVSDRATGNVLMRLSDDDSQSWTKYRPKSLAGAQTRFNRGGNFRRRVYDFRITDNIPVRAQRVEYSIDEGAE